MSEASLRLTLAGAAAATKRSENTGDFFFLLCANSKANEEVEVRCQS